MTALLSSTYFGPIQWYQKLNRYDSILIEQHDSFVKQTYRNRCIIATANGSQALSLPTSPGNKDRGDEGMPQTVNSTIISDHGNWRHVHERIEERIRLVAFL